MKMRPIDADSLKERLPTFAEVIDEEPTIGILPEKVKTRDELIRCKDCKYLEEHHYEEARETLYIKYGCKYRNYQVQLDGYCSSAERKVQMIKDKIDKVVESYYNETDECYNSLRYDNNENDFYMKDEIENLLKKAKVDFKIEIESGFSNCAYDSEFIAVAWIEEGKLNMRTILTEDY